MTIAYHIERNPVPTRQSLFNVQARVLQEWVRTAPKFDGMLTEGQIARQIQMHDVALRGAFQGFRDATLLGVPQYDERNMQLAGTLSRLFIYGAYVAVNGLVDIMAVSRVEETGETIANAKVAVAERLLSPIESADVVGQTRESIMQVVSAKQEYFGGSSYIFQRRGERQVDVPLSYLQTVLGELRAQVEKLAPELSPLLQVDLIYVNSDYPDIANPNFPYAQTAQGQDEILNTIGRIGAAAALLLIINARQSEGEE